MIREVVYDALRNSAAMQSLGVPSDGSTIWTADTVDTLPVKPAWVIRWNNHIPGVGENQGGTWKGAWTATFDIYAHDDYGDYTRIDNMLLVARDVLSALVAIKQSGGTGWYLQQLDWKGESGELIDTGYNTITRFSSWQAALGRG